MPIERECGCMCDEAGVVRLCVYVYCIFLLIDITQANRHKNRENSIRFKDASSREMLRGCIYTTIEWHLIFASK